MSFVRPELAARLGRWRELAAAAVVALAGFGLLRLGGYVFVPLGLAVLALAAGWATIAVRRLRFLRAVAAPGVVEVDEGQVGYFGPAFGGFVALADLAELRLTDLHGARQWRLRTQGGEVLLIPVDAAGADKLYDAFSALPGIDMARLADALDAGMATLPLWRRDRALGRGGAAAHHEKS
ncbi:MAG: hypothetical protein H6895_13765 [Defluviimonas sp.]|uniref:hypothetical protein n=1 Tax=Albidovulum sp. TaxID=1872424 RepID=UPI001E070912|nr:hypothetical protein [Paracoccaceae bacterium]MCC0065130.1 hypothetical protein [Defluviimonas sp.]